jgi:hypothetical protein
MATTEHALTTGGESVISEQNLRKVALQRPYIEEIYRNKSRDLTSSADLHGSAKTSASNEDTYVRRNKPLPANVTKLSINTNPDAQTDETVRINAGEDERNFKTHTLFVEDSRTEKLEQTKATKRLSFLIEGVSAAGFQENYGLHMAGPLSPHGPRPEAGSTAQNSDGDNKYIPLHRRSVSGLIMGMFSALLGIGATNKVAPSG